MKVNAYGIYSPSRAPMAEIDAELLKSTVSQVYVKKGQASLLLKNGQIIERS